MIQCITSRKQKYISIVTGDFILLRNIKLALREIEQQQDAHFQYVIELPLDIKLILWRHKLRGQTARPEGGADWLTAVECFYGVSLVGGSTLPYFVPLIKDDIGGPGMSPLCVCFKGSRKSELVNQVRVHAVHLRCCRFTCTAKSLFSETSVPA